MNKPKLNTKVDRLAARITRDLEGRASGAITVRARLTGPAADAWRGLVKAATGLQLDSAGLLVLLLEEGSGTLRAALSKLGRS